MPALVLSTGAAAKFCVLQYADGPLIPLPKSRTGRKWNVIWIGCEASCWLLRSSNVFPSNVYVADQICGDSESDDEYDLPDDRKLVCKHTVLMVQAGLVSGIETGTAGNPYDYYDLELTWAGHDFIDSVANDSVWERVRKALSDSQVKAAEFSVWARIASDVAGKSLGLKY